MSKEPPTVWTRFTDFIYGTTLTSIAEIHALIPDSILFGSVLLYCLTQNLSFGVFAIFVFETILSHSLISWIIAQTVGPSQSRPIAVDSIQCRAGFKTPQFSLSRIFSHDQYPSYSIFSVMSIATYLGLSTSAFSDTMAQMGKEWQGRNRVAYFMIILFLLAFIGYRLISCDSIGEVMIAMTLAVFSGVGFFFLNKTLFGMEGVNFLGLPYLVSKDSQGKPIYVCSKTL